LHGRILNPPDYKSVNFLLIQFPLWKGNPVENLYQPYDFCLHPDGEFIGIQQDPFRGKSFALFTCYHCHSTFSMPMNLEETAEGTIPMLNDEKRIHRMAV